MSTIPYYPNGYGKKPEYDVGVRDRVGRLDNKDISTFALIVPIYGAWAGPGTAGNLCNFFMRGN